MLFSQTHTGAEWTSGMKFSTLFQAPQWDMNFLFQKHLIVAPHQWTFQQYVKLLNYICFAFSKMLVLNALFSAMLSSSISRHDLLFPKNTSAEFHEWTFRCYFKFLNQTWFAFSKMLVLNFMNELFNIMSSFFNIMSSF